MATHLAHASWQGHTSEAPAPTRVVGVVGEVIGHTRCTQDVAPLVQEQDLKALRKLNLCRAPSMAIGRHATQLVGSSAQDDRNMRCVCNRCLEPLTGFKLHGGAILGLRSCQQWHCRNPCNTNCRNRSEPSYLYELHYSQLSRPGRNLENA